MQGGGAQVLPAEEGQAAPSAGGIVKAASGVSPSGVKAEVEDGTKLNWPVGWNRTLIELRKNETRWKKPLDFYRSMVVRELTLMGATSIMISRGPLNQERLDPGVAVWFSLVKEDYSWQTLLGLGPAPGLDEIDDAFRSKAQGVHPDRQDGGDAEMFLRFTEARKRARAWVQGTHTERHEYVMALDRYTTIRSNLAGLWRAFANFRSLQKLGMPTILERVLDKAFKAALPMNASAASAPGWTGDST
jgi:hypothetical protein